MTALVMMIMVMMMMRMTTMMMMMFAYPYEHTTSQLAVTQHDTQILLSVDMSVSSVNVIDIDAMPTYKHVKVRHIRLPERVTAGPAVTTRLS